MALSLLPRPEEALLDALDSVLANLACDIDLDENGEDGEFIRSLNKMALSLQQTAHATLLKAWLTARIPLARCVAEDASEIDESESEIESVIGANTGLPTCAARLQGCRPMGAAPPARKTLNA